MVQPTTLIWSFVVWLWDNYQSRDLLKRKYFRLDDFEIEFIDGDELSMTKQSVTGCLVIPEQESSESKFGIGDPTLKKNVWRHFHLNPYLILNVSLFNQTAHLYVYHEIYYGFYFLNCRKSFLNLNLSISVSGKGSTDHCSNQGMIWTWLAFLN